MQKGMRKHRSSLKTKVAVIMLLFTVLLSVGTVIISYTTYTESFNRHYESLATSITKTAASVINVKDAAVALELAALTQYTIQTAVQTNSLTVRWQNMHRQSVMVVHISM